MARFDWPGLMRAGLRELALGPHEFWSLTPAELALKLGHGGGPGACNRGRLQELMRRFPDMTGGGTDDRR